MLVDELHRLRETSQDQTEEINSLRRENEELRGQIRLHREVTNPCARPSRKAQGSRSYDDRDLIIHRLETEVASLKDALKVYEEDASERERRRRLRRKQDAEERRELEGPVDLTVAWRPKKNVISERTELLAKRAARRRRLQEEERKTIEQEQRDKILRRYAKEAMEKKQRNVKKRNDYKKLREERILMLTEAEGNRSGRHVSESKFLDDMF